MRILHLVATGQRRGAEVFTADLVAALDAPDLCQRVAVLRGGPPFEVPFGAPVTAVGGRRPGPRRLPLQPGTVWTLRRLVADWRPDLITAHGGEPLKYAVLAAARRRPPIVYRRIGSASGWLSGGPRKLLYGQLMRRADRIVTVADAVRNETLAAFRIPDGRVLTIPNGVDPRRLEPRRGREATRAALGIAPEATVVLSLGALRPEKDPLGHLAVTAPLLRRRPEVVHLFVGGGPLEGELSSAIRDQGLDRQARVLGSRGDVGDLLAASDLLLFASRAVGSNEGMPACVIEAGLRALPVVGVGLTGVPEVVADGLTGLLAPPGDHERLRAAVDRLLADRPLRSAMGRAAQARCRERYGISGVAGAYRHLYRELVGA
jgi:glycosyltransferase involved in cell wall biosynthesis